MIDTIFGSQWPVSQLEKDAIIFQVKRIYVTLDGDQTFQYTDWEHIDDGYLNQKMIGDVVGDFFFVCPCNYFAMQYAEHGNKVFYYYFNHVSHSIFFVSTLTGCLLEDELQSVGRLDGSPPWG